MLDLTSYGDAARPLRFFEEFSKIPHGSGNTAKIADYLEGFAKERGLFCVRDGANNVIIRKNATRGYENEPAIIFQGHIDMVAEKTPASKKDMARDGLELYVDGDFLRAKETTLGGDDGVAIAYALAVLDADDIEHPEFEAVFTSDEETGLDGANALDCSLLHGSALINVDSDDEGVFTVGCAGGLRLDAQLPVKREPFGQYCYELELGGLLGGHSGVEINKGRLNAIKLLGEAVSTLGDVRLVSMDGGNMDNAIPRHATALLMANAPLSAERLTEFISARRAAEPEIFVRLEEARTALLPLDADSERRFLHGLAAVPFGVIAMSRDIPELVETSMNLGILKTEGDAMKLSYSLRSSVEAEKAKLKARVRAEWESLGARVTERGEYPAWEYRKDSPLRDVMCSVFRELYGRGPEIVTIHAGLECGIFASKMPKLDCVSLGPDNFDIHTTEERLSLSSFGRVWEYLKAVLKKL